MNEVLTLLNLSAAAAFTILPFHIAFLASGRGKRRVTASMSSVATLGKAKARDGILE